jgi:hypothetical protein
MSSEVRFPPWWQNNLAGQSFNLTEQSYNIAEKSENIAEQSYNLTGEPYLKAGQPNNIAECWSIARSRAFCPV